MEDGSRFAGAEVQLVIGVREGTPSEGVRSAPDNVSDFVGVAGTPLH